VRPFSISEGAKALVGTYLPAETLKAVLHSLRYEEKLGVLRLWVSEGIPFAFQNAPLLYESIRHWLGARISVHPKLITMIGSARLGYSLAPLPAFGKPLSPASDLDLSIVAETVFGRLCRDFERWKGDIKSGSVRPRNAAEERFWRENLERLPQNILRGFVDPYKIPTLAGYDTVRQLRHTEWLLRTRLEITPEAPLLSGISIRVYRDWQSFLNQLDRNLHRTLTSFGIVPAVI
jgi:hypothetical protein